ncbi:MAG: hypothetical protein KZQ90_05710 [Candidatus Thiodiazotropha sp. (ex Codakia rugifera)]|nr:hypothetical protein [Candidatus Thiodiazotropha sp. (ex Codakia rugifera)]
MQLTTLPVLLLIIFGLLWYLVRRLYRMGSLRSVEQTWLNVLLAILLAWGGLVSYQSSQGILTSQQFLSLLPGYWMPYVVTIFIFVATMLVPSLRSGLRTFATMTPMYWLTGIHIVRMLAVGTLIKASLGLFPEKFAWFVGGPDLLFGLSAVVVTFQVWRGRMSESQVMLWHLTGALVILVPIIGFMHLFMQERLYSALFQFPMVLAPALVVPLLVMLNLLSFLQLLEKRVHSTGMAQLGTGRES